MNKTTLDPEAQNLVTRFGDLPVATLRTIQMHRSDVSASRANWMSVLADELEHRGLEKLQDALPLTQKQILDVVESTAPVIADLRQAIEEELDLGGDSSTLVVTVTDWMHRHGIIVSTGTEQGGQWIRCTPEFISNGGKCAQEPRRGLREHEKQDSHDVGHCHWVGVVTPVMSER